MFYFVIQPLLGVLLLNLQPVSSLSTLIQQIICLAISSPIVNFDCRIYSLSQVDFSITLLALGSHLKLLFWSNFLKPIHPIGPVQVPHTATIPHLITKHYDKFCFFQLTNHALADHQLSISVLIVTSLLFCFFLKHEKK